MAEIKVVDISNGNIEICKELCNELMEFQANQSHTRTDILQEMTFDNRLKPSFKNAQIKKVLVALDGDKPIGYAYAEVSDVTKDAKYFVPTWAKSIYKKGQSIFFPDKQDLPSRLGTFNNLYIKPDYHGLKLGYQLSKNVIDWMKNIDGTTGIYVYVSNGNERVVDFYKGFGFEFSHNVFGGFITAYYLKA